TFWDNSVHPTELPFRGEFFATVDICTSFTLKRMSENDEIFGAERFMSKEINQNPQFMYYKAKPRIRGTHETKTGRTDFFEILSAGQYKDVGEGWEIIHYYGWINPKMFGLSNVNEYQIWRITLISDKYIVALEHLNNAHGLLPIFITMPIDDGL